jgi:DNA-binding CsgD family transcriptional regulator
MPPLTDEQTRRNVVREWISGIPRDQIAEHIGIGAGTVSSIIANYKAGLEELDFDSIRQLAVEARQHGWNFTDLASHARLYNYFVKSGAAEDKIESFIDNINSSNLSPEKIAVCESIIRCFNGTINSTS